MNTIQALRLTPAGKGDGLWAPLLSLSREPGSFNQAGSAESSIPPCSPNTRSVWSPNPAPQVGFVPRFAVRGLLCLVGALLLQGCSVQVGYSRGAFGSKLCLPCINQ